MKGNVRLFGKKRSRRCHCNQLNTSRLFYSEVRLIRRRHFITQFDEEAHGRVKYGGERGIRTLDRVSPIHAFQACAFNHSAISPVRKKPPLAVSQAACESLNRITWGVSNSSPRAGWTRRSLLLSSAGLAACARRRLPV